MTSPFTTVAPALIERGYVVHPIAPGSKTPGTYNNAGWTPQIGWAKRARVFPNVLAEWMKWPDAGIGVLTGRGLICIDIDLEEAVGPLLEILPLSNVQKKGRKGISLFYRGDTEKIRSKNFRTPERVGLVDLLAEGKQTVLPPSIHPDTGEPYVWMTPETLLNRPIEDLTELPDDIAERIAEVLIEFGYDPERDRVGTIKTERVLITATLFPSEISTQFREVNARALADLQAWVPKLGLQRCFRSSAGYKAVAEWRSSSTGRPLPLREANLSFRTDGIRDFGDGRGYTPIDVVIAARRLSAPKALEWLAPLLGVQTTDHTAAAMAERLLAASKLKKRQ